MLRLEKHVISTDTQPRGTNTCLLFREMISTPEKETVIFSTNITKSGK